MPLLIVVLGALAIYLDLPGSRFITMTNTNAGFNQTLETKLGLDLQGGFSITYQAQPVNGQPVTSANMDVIRGIIENRINKTGAVEPIVQTVGSDEVLIEVPGASDPGQIRDLVGTPGRLEFVLLPPEKYGKNGTTGPTPLPNDGDKIDASLPVQFTGAQLDPGSIHARYDTSTNKWAVTFAFQGDAANQFATWSGAHVNDFFAIVLDGKIQSHPYIASQITGSGEISGSFDSASANNLATILQSGALPNPVLEISSTEIPATLGRSFLDQTLLAGAIGIGLVLLFMLIYYRLPGLIACLALLYYGLAVLAIFRLIPVTLTLAGIAGFVLSVGMAVDANILIFERTKEELRSGKTLVSAVEAGFNRAWNSIFDSNISSLITAGILYFGGSSTIKGFALVLAIGVATSMFTAVTVSRTLMRAIVTQGFAQRAWLYGVTDEEFQARALQQGRYRREARARV